MMFLASAAAFALSLLAWISKKGGQYTASLPMIVIASLVLSLSQCFTVIPAGHVGIVDFFGRVSAVTLKAGINMRNPLARIIKMSIKTQEVSEVMDVPSKEGLSVSLDASLLFHLDPEKAGEIYKTVGEDYTKVILIPQFRSATRGVTAMYDAKALYTSEREALAQAITKELAKAVAPRGIVIESVPLRKIGLPSGLSASIEQKLQSEQESQRMQFVLQKEQQEAERKGIEATGIANYQKIVSQSLSDEVLRLKGIEATEKLASSSNSKIIVIGGKDGLPLILNGDK